MSASQPGNMRGPWVKTPLLLLLLLLTSLTWTVLCQEEDGEAVEAEAAEETPDETETGDGDGEPEATESPPTVSDSTLAPDPSVTDESVVENSDTEHGSGYGITVADDVSPASTEVPFAPELGDDQNLGLIIISVLVGLVVVIIGMIVCGIFLKRRWNKNTRNQELRKEDPYLDGSSTEKVPMPMFEEDVPSVLELEMEELDQWMKKDGENAEDTKHA